MALIDTGLYVRDFIQNIIAFLEANLNTLSVNTSMGTMALKEVHYGRRVVGVLNLPAADVYADPRVSLEVTERAGNWLKEVSLDVIIRVLTYNMNAEFNEEVNDMLCGKVFNLMDSQSAHSYFAQVPPGGTQPYMARIFSSRIIARPIELQDGRFLGGYVQVRGIRKKVN
jgi:hypothetical protein